MAMDHTPIHRSIQEDSSGSGLHVSNLITRKETAFESKIVQDSLRNSISNISIHEEVKNRMEVGQDIWGTGFFLLSERRRVSEQKHLS